MAYIPRSMTPDSFIAACEAKGLENQVEIASVLGVKQSTVSRWRTGARKIPPIVAVALLGVQPRRTAARPPKTRNGRTRKASTQKG